MDQKKKWIKWCLTRSGYDPSSNWEWVIFEFVLLYFAYEKKK